MDLCNFSWFSFCPAVFPNHWHPQAIYSSSVFFSVLPLQYRRCAIALQCNSVNIAAAWSRRKPPDSYCKCKTMDHVFSTLSFSTEWKSQHYFYIVLYNRRNLNGIITCTICLCNSSDSHHWYRQTAQTVETVQTVHFTANEFPVSMAQISWL